MVLNVHAVEAQPRTGLTAEPTSSQPREVAGVLVDRRVSAPITEIHVPAVVRRDHVPGFEEGLDR